MTPVERLQAALEAKERGNELFKKSRIREAIAEYKEVSTIVSCCIVLTD